MIILESFEHVHLTVKNLEVAKKFYGELFDFEVIQEYESQNAVLIELENIRIKLLEDTDFKGAEKENTVYMSFGMDVDDFTDALEELEEKEVPLINGPLAEDGGECVYIADPDGYKIKLAYRE